MTEQELPLSFVLREPASPTCRTLYGCSRCGALVVSLDFDLHEQWHLAQAAEQARARTLGPGLIG